MCGIDVIFRNLYACMHIDEHYARELSNSIKTVKPFISVNISLLKLKYGCLSVLPTECCQISMKSRA